LGTAADDDDAAALLRAGDLELARFAGDFLGGDFLGFGLARVGVLARPGVLRDGVGAFLAGVVARVGVGARLAGVGARAGVFRLGVRGRALDFDGEAFFGFLGFEVFVFDLLTFPFLTTGVFGAAGFVDFRDLAIFFNPHAECTSTAGAKTVN